MGILRFLLANAILFAHLLTVYSGGQIIIPSIAVPSFYVISGFYMALILNEKYNKPQYLWTYYSNRLLRIFPLYWTVLVILILLSIAKQVVQPGSETLIGHIENIYHSSFPSFNNYIVRNLTLIITTDYFIKTNATDGYLVIQQAQTLQCELLFYLLAPLVTRLKSRNFLIMGVIYGITIFILPSTIFVNTLTATFINSLLYFMLGIISYKIYVVMKYTLRSNRYIRAFSWWFCIGIVFLHLLIFFNILSFSMIFLWVYFSLLVISLPVLFSWKNNFSNFLGELSYPVYLVQFLVVKIVSNSIFHVSIPVVIILTFTVTFILSWLLTIYIQKPIDTLRHKYSQ